MVILLSLTIFLQGSISKGTRMSAQIKQTFSSQSTYYVINMKDDHWVKISDIYFNLEEAKNAYLKLLKRHPFARLGGSKYLSVKK